MFPPELQMYIRRPGIRPVSKPMPQNSAARKRGLMVFLAAMTVFRFYFIWHGNINLSPDEAHYWEWSRRLAIGYYSKGPVIAWLIKAGTLLFGNTELGVRFFAPLLSLGGSVLLYLLGRELYDGQTAIWASALFQVVPLFSVFGVIMTIDAPILFFWILALFLFYRALKTDSTADWVAAGLAVGAGMLTKLTMSFFILSVFLYLVTGRERKRLLSLRPYAGLLACMALFAPLLYWNAHHNWVNFRHEMGHADIQAGLRVSAKSFFQFLGSQFGVITPVLFALMVYAIVKDRKEPVLHVQGKEISGGRFSFRFAAPTLVFFLLKSVQGKVQANWAMTGYITGLFAFSHVFLGKQKKYPSGGFPGRRKKILSALAVATCLFAAAVTYYPSIAALPPKLDLQSRLKGWRELAAEVEKKAPPAPYFVFSDAYQASSELAFYMRGHPITYCARTGRRMNQYDLWPGFEGLRGENAVFVTIGAADLPEAVRDAFAGFTKKTFTEKETGGHIVTGRDKKGKLLSVYTIYTCYGFRGMKEEPIKEY